MRNSCILVIALLLACSVVPPEAGVLVDTAGTPDGRSAIASRIIARLQSGELESALRAAVPGVTDEELQSAQLRQEYHSDEKGNSGTQIICTIDIFDDRDQAAIQACIKAIQQALGAELQASPGA